MASRCSSFVVVQEWALWTVALSTRHREVAALVPGRQSLAGGGATQTQDSGCKAREGHNGVPRCCRAGHI